MQAPLSRRGPTGSRAMRTREMSAPHSVHKIVVLGALFRSAQVGA